MVAPWREAAPAFAAVLLAVAVMAPMTRLESTGAVLDGEQVEQFADGAAPSRTTAPGSQAQASHAQAPRRLGQAADPAGVTAANPRDRGVDVAPAGRGGDVEGAVTVGSDRSQPRLPAPGEQRASR